MVDEVNITQQGLDLIAEYVKSNVFTHLTTGTGSTDVTLTTTDVDNFVQIDGGTRNLAEDTSSITNNFWKRRFRMTGAMPQTLPVDLRQFGTHTTTTASTNLTFGVTLPVDITKDDASQWDITLTGKVVELERTDIE